MGHTNVVKSSGVTSTHPASNANPSSQDARTSLPKIDWGGKPVEKVALTIGDPNCDINTSNAVGGVVGMLKSLASSQVLPQA